MKRNVVIMGAAGRDFHNFLTYFKPRSDVRVVAFTAEQIPGIADRVFPAELAGPDYPNGIPIHPEDWLVELIEALDVDDVCLAYSDLSNQQVMEKAALILSQGANFLLLGARDTCVQSKKPVVAITAVRTGCGKSQTARAIGEILRRGDRRVVAIRHSMPYGHDLVPEACQRFADPSDFRVNNTTIEEEEEYQPWLDHGFVVYSGFDYHTIVARAEAEADILIFDGGNNDLPMVAPDVMITVVDPHRVGHESLYYPGLSNLLAADAVVINKVDSAAPDDVEQLAANVRRLNPEAAVIRATSELVIDRPELITGKRCLVIGDGPTLTHGGMKFGAGTLAVQRHGGELVDPRSGLVGSIAEVFGKYPHLESELPAMGYGPEQIAELEETVNKVSCDVVIDGSPANLGRVMKIAKPVVNVDYELGEAATRELERLLSERGLS